MSEATTEGAKRGAGSFCIPRASVEALLNAKATAYQISTFLTLASFTDETGQYAVAGISAVNRYTGANKTHGGPIDRAIQRLQKIEATIDQAKGKPKSLGPIVYARDVWHEQTGELLPDGPVERSKVLHILPTFNEPLSDRVWFSRNLVTGFGEFRRPLTSLKNAGDVAARLFLALAAANDMEQWGGVPPNKVAWCRYHPVAPDKTICNGTARLIRSKYDNQVARIDPRIVGGDGNESFWDAVQALETSGLIYEVVMVLNRNGVKSDSINGDQLSSIPDDAEPLYELDTRSRHGFKPDGEMGLAWATARTAGDCDAPVTTEGGTFDRTYAAIVPSGYPAMIAGIYRLRFRVANAKNAGVKGAWAGIHQRNNEALAFINRARQSRHLPEMKEGEPTPDRKRPLSL